MSMKNVRYIIYLLVIIIVLFACSVGFVLLLKDSKANEVPPVQDDDVSFIAEKDVIDIKSIISVSDDFGRNLDEENNGAFGYLKFDVKNNTGYDRGFQIYITKNDLDEKEEINAGYITFYLTNLSDIPMSGYTENKLPSYYDLKVISDKADSKSLYSGIIKGNETLHYVLRVWIADNYVVLNNEKKFSFEIGARAV